jgi:large subunit ribosomal protein L32e
MGVNPIRFKKKIKKKTNKFKRYHSWRYKRVKESWRRPHGIDSAFRRRFRGYPKLVNIGYGNPKKTRHVLPNGFKKFLIRKVADIELLLMNNRTFCGEIARNLSSRKKDAIVRRA